MLEFDANRLRKALESLDAKQQLAFALSCCERLYPNYTAFVREYSWGDPSLLREALDIGWMRLCGESGEEDFDELNKRLEAVTPDTENFVGMLVSPALDAAVATCLLLDFLMDRSIVRILDIAGLCRDTVDMYVEEIGGFSPSEPNIRERIVGHELFQAELQRQRKDIEFLNTADLDDAGVIDELQEQWRDPPKSNIGL